MSKKLAIKGHSTRGKEVIELLKMMGGYKDSLLKDEDIYDDNYFYFILAEENNAIDGYPLKYKDKVDEDYVIFTLEEFLERFPYKVGDEFCNPYDKITEMFWDEEDEIVYYKTEYSRDYVTTTDIMLDNYARIK